MLPSSPSLRRTDSVASQSSSSSACASSSISSNSLLSSTPRDVAYDTPAGPAELKRTFTDCDFVVPPIDLSVSDSESSEDELTDAKSASKEREIWIRCDDARLVALVQDFMSRHHIPSSYTGHLWIMDELCVLLDKAL